MEPLRAAAAFTDEDEEDEEGKKEEEEEEEEEEEKDLVEGVGRADEEGGVNSTDSRGADSAGASFEGVAVADNGNEDDNSIPEAAGAPLREDVEDDVDDMDAGVDADVDADSSC